MIFCPSWALNWNKSIVNVIVTVFSTKMADLSARIAWVKICAFNAVRIFLLQKSRNGYHL